MGRNRHGSGVGTSRRLCQGRWWAPGWALELEPAHLGPIHDEAIWKGMIMTEVPRPLMLGYVRVTVYTGSKERAELARSLTEFADREGFALGELFVQSNMMRDGSALVALAEAAAIRDVSAICIPDITHLGDTEMLQRETREWLENKTGVSVLAATLR